MKRILTKFFRKGTDTQKRADITVELKMPDKKIVASWSTSERLTALAFIKEARNKFNDWADRAESIFK